MSRRIRRAAQAVEFALLLPVVLILLAGITDFGWFFTQQLGVTQAAREGVRAGALAWGDDDPVFLAHSAAQAVVDGWNLSGVVIDAQLRGDASLGSVIEVSVTAPYDPLFHLIPAPDHLGQTVIMRTEPHPPPSS